MQVWYCLKAEVFKSLTVRGIFSRNHWLLCKTDAKPIKSHYKKSTLTPTPQGKKSCRHFGNDFRGNILSLLCPPWFQINYLIFNVLGKFISKEKGCYRLWFAANKLISQCNIWFQKILISRQERRHGLRKQLHHLWPVESQKIVTFSLHSEPRIADHSKIIRRCSSVQFGVV